MDIIDKSWEIQEKIEERFKGLGKGKYGRVLKMSRKPTNEEYRRTILLAGLGVILIGMLGFAIYLLAKWVRP
jgi:protein transport protein SEC61 subunit gamma-like protein